MKKVFVFLSFLCVSASVLSQNLEPFQYLQNPLLLNPAFAGSDKALKISADTRINFLDIYFYGKKNNTIIGLPSNTFAADHYFNKIKSGIGINFNSTYPSFGDNMVHLTRTGLDYSFHIPVGKDSAGNAKYFFQPGIEYAYQYNIFDTSQLTYAPNYPYPHLQVKDKVGYNDLSAGFIFYGKDICIGFSARHLNQPDAGFIGVYKLPTIYSGSLTYTIRFGTKHNFFFQPNATYLNYNGYHSYSQSKQVVLVGAKLNLASFYFGISYSTDQVFAYSFGIHEGRYMLSYLYEHNSTKAEFYWMTGAHQITLRVKLFTKENKGLVSTKDNL